MGHMASKIQIKENEMTETNEKITIDPLCVAQNSQAIQRVRNMTSIVFGCAAGVLGLTGLNGFLFYLLLFTAASIGLLLRMGFKSEKYFVKKTPIRFMFSGIGSQIVAFIMYWTFSYALVHLY
eukprot:maker-scaffold_11-snap-gene-10.16-mRNA-1 protein AED:0.00 eAED:0.00 QI:52/1/1/1/1/1/2/34/122